MCVNPLKIRTTKKDGNTFNPLIHRIINIVPCGKCYECLSQKSNDYYARALAEYEHTKKLGGYTLFVTLTYNNDNLPKLNGIPCFSKEHLSQFYKNLRRFGVVFKYLQSSEYGSQTHRPHYHLLLHVFSSHSVCQLQQLIRRFWSFGFSYFGLNNGVVNSSIALKYVTKYVCKDFHTVNYLRSKGMDESYKSLFTTTKRGSVDYTFNNFHHNSIGYGISLAETLSDSDFINGYFHKITCDNLQQKFAIPFYIQRKCLYRVSYLFTGSPVYVYNDRYLRIYKQKLLHKYDEFKTKVETVQQNIYSYFSKTNYEIDAYKEKIVNFLQLDSDEFSRYVVFYRGFADYTRFSFNFKSDLSLFAESYKTQLDDNPILLNPDEFNAQLINFYEDMYNFYNLLIIPYKYELYIKNTTSYRINQVFRSLKSGFIKKQVIFTLPQYVNYCLKKVA